MNKIVQFKKIATNFGSKLSCIVLLGFALILCSQEVRASHIKSKISVIQLINEKNVTLDLKEKPLRDILVSIRQQTGIGFGFNSKVNHSELQSLTISAKEEKVASVLERLLDGTDYYYKILGEEVIIIPKEEQVAKAQPQENKVTVKGKILDDAGKPIAGATIIILGTTDGTITGSNGEFEIKIKAGSSVEVSFMGYVTVTQVVNQAADNLIIKMKTETMAVNDVVVTGYQKIERRKLTSSVTTINMDDLKSINQPSVDKLLQGQVAGMTIMSTSGAPGAVPQIRIRGTSTLSGTVQPLWVVDGIILDDPVNASVDDILTNRNLIASGIGGVNVEDIESINVLKDAAATAIYGTRAANGVIVITSKKGKSGRTSVKYSSHLNISMRPQLSDAYMMNSQERVDVNREMMAKGIFAANSSGVGKYGTATDFERYFIDATDRLISWEQFEGKVRQLEQVNTDWFDELFRNSFTHRHNISVSGGSENTTFYISGSYMDEQATAKGVGQKTYTGTAKVYTKPWKNLRVGASVDINVRDNDSFFSVDSWENPYEWAIYTTRAHNAYTPDGEYNYMYYNGMEYNFMENREAGWRKSTNYGVRANFDLEWKICKDLIFTSIFSYNRSTTVDEDIATENSYFVKKRKEDVTIIDGYYAVPVWKDGGYLKEKNTNAHSLTFRNQISYMPVINEHHRFDVMVGQEIRKSVNKYTDTEVYGYVHDRGRQQIPQYDLIEHLGRPYWTLNLDRNITSSFYGTAGYTFKNRYTASFNARLDGSNRFGIKTNELFQPLWAVGLNYQLKEENFLKNREWLTYLTIKGSYGTQGNIASQAYSDLITRIGTSDGINNEGYLVIAAPKNPNLKWEKTYNMNVGLEFGFFNRRLEGSIEYYNKKAVDLLGSKQVSQVTGFNSIQVNWASMRNEGVEFAVKSINIDRALRWTTSFNIGYNRNEVLDVYASPTAASLVDANRTNYAASAVIGKPINGLWSYRYAGLNEDGRATFYTGNDGKTVLTGVKNISDLEYSGTTMPPIQGGLTNTFYFKKFTLSALFVGSFGNVIRMRNLSQGYAFGYPDATKNMSREWVNRWRNPGDENLGHNVPRLESDTWEPAVTASSPYNGKMYDNSDLRTTKGNFVRLQNISLSYDIYNEKMRKAGIQNINVMVQGNNLKVWHSSKLKGQDPEATGSMMKYSDTRTANVSFGNTYLPLPRTFSLSISIQF